MAKQDATNNDDYIDPVIAAIEARLANEKTQLGLSEGLQNMTPQEAVDWVEANVNTLPTAKTLLKRMVRILMVLLERSGWLS